jgi:hypothetical protein
MNQKTLIKGAYIKMDFKSYAAAKNNGGGANNAGSNGSANNGGANGAGNASNFNGNGNTNADATRGKSANFAAEDINRVNNVVNSYAGKSDDAMLNDLMSMVSEQKRSGKLSNADLDNFALSAANMLTIEQKNKMLSLIEILKQND